MRKRKKDVPVTTVTKLVMDISHLARVDRLKSVVRRRKLGFRRLRRYQAAVGRHCPGGRERNRDERGWASCDQTQSFRHKNPVRVEAENPKQSKIWGWLA